MPIRDVFKITRKTFFNPAGWIDFDALKSQNQTIFSTIKALFSAPQPERQETFEEAMQRLGLTEEDVTKTARVYRWYAVVFFLLGFIAFVYAFYLLFGHYTITGWLLGLGASGLFLVQAFKYDFWSFQMRSRKLGLTVSEWTSSILGGGKG